MSAQYKVVPFIGRVDSGAPAAELAKQLAAAFASNTSDGWEYHSLSHVGVEVAPGCLAGPFGAKVSYEQFDQLVFSRLLGSPARDSELLARSRGQAVSNVAAMGFSTDVEAVLDELEGHKKAALNLATSGHSVSQISKELQKWRNVSKEDADKLAASVTTKR